MIHLLHIGTLIFTFIVCTQALDYTDLARTGKACPQRDSCRHVVQKEFLQRNCECDRLCSVFQDCCIDAPRTSTSLPKRSKGPTCMPYGDKDAQGAYIVDRCPRSYRSSDKVKNFCHGHDKLQDPLFSTPTTDTVTGVTYRNRYCAECNGALRPSLKFWLVSVNFRNLPSNSLSDDFVLKNLKYYRNQWGIRYGRQFYPSTLIFHKPDNLSTVRHCRPNIISSCPSRWGNPADKSACASYMAVVQKDNKVYKNIHCAVCNGENIGTIFCVNNQMFSKRTDTTPLSFAHLMDFNFANGNKIGLTQEYQCNPGSMYDVFRKICRRIECAIPGFKLVDGKCHE
ncbi:SMB domain-containing protein [Trichonephila clavata]|uniref:SMB domain-containing protein n=1 Tax=Trichonephila clavata TaxID=2740835 RepID=A0A8X6G242_TRICU|nr:SMB domain-containing protein [Trichonephila clavata]